MWMNFINIASSWTVQNPVLTFQTRTLMWIQDWSASSVNPKFFEHEALNQLGHELLNLSDEVYKQLSCDKSLAVQLGHVILQVYLLGMVGIMWCWWFCRCVAQLPHVADLFFLWRVEVSQRACTWGEMSTFTVHLRGHQGKLAVNVSTACCCCKQLWESFAGSVSCSKFWLNIQVKAANMIIKSWVKGKLCHVRHVNIFAKWIARTYSTTKLWLLQVETEVLHVILQTAISCDIDIIRCLHFHMSGQTSSEAVAQWSGGNPGFLGPAERMLILTWIHTHTVTHTCWQRRWSW